MPVKGDGNTGFRQGRAPGVAAARSAVVIALTAALLAGCAPVVRTHGYVPLEEDLTQIRTGQDTRGSVRRKIGRPGGSGIFTDQGWYYVSSEIEHFMYREPRIIDRKVVEVLFDRSDRVIAINKYGLDDGQIVALETDTTPTYGRELTVIEQAFGNIGIATDEVFGDN